MNKRLELLFKECLKRKSFNRLLSIIKRYRNNVSLEEIESLIKEGVRQGRLDFVLEAVELIPREIRPQEASFMLNKFIKWGWFGGAETVVHFLGRRLVALEIDTIVKNQIRTGGKEKLLQALDGMERNHDNLLEQTVDAFIAKSVEMGRPKFAVRAASLGKKCLTTQEFRNVLINAINKTSSVPTKIKNLSEEEINHYVQAYDEFLKNSETKFIIISPF